jgi:hypothetical protein
VSRYETRSCLKKFQLSDTDAMEPPERFENVEHSLRLTFTAHCFTESHPYGSTTASENLMEPEEDSYAYELDGQPTTEKELAAKFGEDWLERFTEKLINDAEATS